ncbi:MAG TPA: methyltransferase domain-containing protein [Myxococcota bacterium]|nr:methyltransferase domain-containing protein [Myxococcota bacterium]HRY94508.1 methyltransferase domain-containing protein [Myxococcota bacterium]HSA21577.1 methyltransferase domain-containing protein [Myxococcota bacterium]
MTHLCPWWLTYTFDNPLRRLLHDPARILGPHLRPGMRAADIGCGMGYFTAALARLVGPGGRVQAVDLQPEQLARVARRAARAGVAERVECLRASPERLGLQGPLDFALAFWMVHEVPEQDRFFAELAAALAPAGRVLVAEPRLHVDRAKFERGLAAAARQGLVARPLDGIRLSRAALLGRPG